MCPLDTVFSPKLVQHILQKNHIDIDGSKNDPKGFVSNYGHSGWKKNCHSVAFNNVFFLRPVRFLLSWKKLFLTISHWELDVLTLKISNINNRLSSDCTHLWNDAVILELLLQQSVFLLQCFNLVKSIFINVAIFVKFWEST